MQRMYVNALFFILYVDNSTHHYIMFEAQYKTQKGWYTRDYIITPKGA